MLNSDAHPDTVADIAARLDADPKRVERAVRAVTAQHGLLAVVDEFGYVHAPGIERVSDALPGVNPSLAWEVVGALFDVGRAALTWLMAILGGLLVMAAVLALFWGSVAAALWLLTAVTHGTAALLVLIARALGLAP